MTGKSRVAVILSLFSLSLLFGSSRTSDDSHIVLPKGFTATIFADGLGRARHLAVSTQGLVYVKLDKLKDGKGIVCLRDINGDGKADRISSFGNYKGTGIAIRNGWLYASSNTEIFRYRLNEKDEVTTGQTAQRIVTGLIDRREHESKSIALDDSGNIYTNVGAYSNSCQHEDRVKGSMGIMPCSILDSAGGIWRFSANKQDQTYGDGIRYATGLRNVVGLDWNKQVNKLFVMQHGRDQLKELFPDLYDVRSSAELPAETMYELTKGDDAGWPYLYYDHLKHQKIVAPEYGGDGKKVSTLKTIDPVAAYPGHMAPNGLLFYTGNLFPAKYRNGAFIAFHGSWNRAPEIQAGYFVAFQPFSAGKPSGKWETFASRFAGSDKVISPSDAQHRPCGLAMGPDGSLFVSDDVKGTIYKITYKEQ